MHSFKHGKDFKTAFDPVEFVKHNVRLDLVNGDTAFLADCLYKIYSEGHVRGKRLIDIGTGPSLYNVIPAEKYFEEIILTDYAEVNIDFQRRWLDEKPGAIDWENFFRFYSKKDGNEEDWKDKEKRLRRKIKDVVFCDVNQSNPLYSSTVRDADAISTFYCLDFACADEQEYKQGVKNMASLLKFGGRMISGGVLENGHYSVGTTIFRCCFVTKENVLESYTEAGLDVLDYKSKLCPYEDRLLEFFVLLTEKKKI